MKYTLIFALLLSSCYCKKNGLPIKEIERFSSQSNCYSISFISIKDTINLYKIEDTIGYSECNRFELGEMQNQFARLTYLDTINKNTMGLYLERGISDFGINRKIIYAFGFCKTYDIDSALINTDKFIVFNPNGDKIECEIFHSPNDQIVGKTNKLDMLIWEKSNGVIGFKMKQSNFIYLLDKWRTIV